MQTKEAILYALTFSDRAVLSIIDEMSDAPTTFPTPNGGCHPLWVLGHLALVEGGMQAVLFGTPNPVAEWQPIFGDKSQPVADRAAYPAFAEVRAKYVELRESNLKLVQSLTEADLDKPTVAPPKGLEHEFDTWGRSFLTLALHRMLHRANVTDARRAAGRTVLAARN
ncbi:MAG: DinB family protein [Candidatus Solibacter sp.]